MHSFCLAIWPRGLLPMSAFYSIPKFKLLCFFFIILLSSGYAVESKVAILGESFTNGNGVSGFNEEVVGRLFSIIRDKRPDAVIFTGNMVLGLDRNLPKEEVPMTFKARVSRTWDVGSEEDVWPHEGFQYNSNAFQKQLNAFLHIKESRLGNEIPFYPIIGMHEAFGPDSSKQFISAFKLKSVAKESVSPLSYTFTINNSLFILFSNAKFNEHTQSTLMHSINRELLDWLNQILVSQRKKYDFAFVIGNEPAFSTTASIGLFQGLDKDPDSRNRFWKILLDNQVTAYFCSKEHLYDRTNRYGIWQIISGGGGAAFYKREFDKAFYHFLLLSIPGTNQQLPKIQVFDAQGVLADEFDLSPSTYPVYQLRISTK